jgi:hypothetical protein
MANVGRIENLVMNVKNLGVNEVTQDLENRGVNISPYPSKKVLFPDE